MTKTKKHTKLTKLIAVFLIMAVSVACLSVTACAEAFYQYIITDDFHTTPGDSFSSGSNNRLTVSAAILNCGVGTATQAKVILQRFNGSGWVSIDEKIVNVVENTNNPPQVWVDHVISPNTSYRLCLKYWEGSGAVIFIEAHIGVGMWQHS